MKYSSYFGSEQDPKVSFVMILDDVKTNCFTLISLLPVTNDTQFLTNLYKSTTVM